MRNREMAIILVLACSAIVSGCSDGVYATAAGENGSVLVVNRFTGAVSKVTDDGMVELGTRMDPVVLDVPKDLGDQGLPRQPLRISGRVKHADDVMLLRLEMRPDEFERSEEQLLAWREHLANVYRDGRLFIDFEDSDGFLVTTFEVVLSGLTRRVDNKGNLGGLSGQFRVPADKQMFQRISQWSIGWSGLPDAPPLAAGTQPPSTQPTVPNSGT